MQKIARKALLAVVGLLVLFIGSILLIESMDKAIEGMSGALVESVDKMADKIPPPQNSPKK